MADDAAAAPSGSGAKKDVSTAILQRKKSPNRLIVGASPARSISPRTRQI
jgi:hypothetical protein